MTATTQTPFQILGVSVRDDHATIRAAWKRLVKANHPDRCPADAARLTRRLAELNAAYDKLRNHVPFTAGKPQARDFAAEMAAEAARKARAEAAAKVQADAAARARAKAEAQAAAEARARRAAAEAAAQAARRAKPLSTAEAQAVAAATRAFSSARAALDAAQRPDFARAA